MANGSLIRRLALVESKIGTEAGWQSYDSDAMEARTEQALLELGISSTPAEAESKGFETIAAELAAHCGYAGEDGFKEFRRQCAQASAEYEGAHEWRWVPGKDWRNVCQVRDRR